MASLPVLPVAWFIALQEHPLWMPIGYLGYLLVVIAIPGTLFWRRLTGGTGWFTADVALGTAFGLAVEAFIYPVGRYFDIPLAALVMPALALGVFRAIPRREVETQHTPWWAMAGVMVAVGVIAAWFVRVGSRLVPLNGPAALRPDSDSARNLSLAAELTHHFPPQIPYASGRPLTNHFAVYDHIASAHWISSVELDVLTQRMVPFAFMILTALCAAAVGMVLTGRAVAAPIAAGLTVAAGDLAAWPWTVDARLFNESPLSMTQLTNPSQAFSTVLLLPLLAVTAMLLRRKPGQTRAELAALFVTAGILITALAAAKASALPVYAFGLAAAWVYLTVQAGRVNLRALVLGSMAAICYGFSFAIVLRGRPSGVEVHPAKIFRNMMDRMTELHTTAALVVIAVIVVIGWLLPAAGALLIRRRLPRDPMMVLLLVSLLGSVIAAGLLYDDGQTPVYFVRTGFVYGVLLATWGLGSLERRQYYVAAPAMLIGVAAIYWGRYRSEDSCTSANCFAQPFVVALVIAAIGVGLFGRARTDGVADGRVIGQVREARAHGVRVDRAGWDRGGAVHPAELRAGRSDRYEPALSRGRRRAVSHWVLLDPGVCGAAGVGGGLGVHVPRRRQLRGQRARAGCVLGSGAVADQRRGVHRADQGCAGDAAGEVRGAVVAGRRAGRGTAEGAGTAGGAAVPVRHCSRLSVVSGA
jgi:hypothetical protein